MSFRELLEGSDKYYVIATDSKDGIYGNGEWFYSQPFKIHSDALKLRSKIKSDFKQVSIKKDFEIEHIIKKNKFNKLNVEV